MLNKREREKMMEVNFDLHWIHNKMVRARRRGDAVRVANICVLIEALDGFNEQEWHAYLHDRRGGPK